MAWLSVSACVVIIGLWIVSYFWDARLSHTRSIGGGQVANEEIMLRQGDFSLRHYELLEGRWLFAFGRLGWDGASRFRPSEPMILFALPEWEHFTTGSDMGLSFTMPFWLLTVVFLLPAALSVRYLIHRRRRLNDRTRCCTCGYDLRATPERCPECGSMVVKPTAN